MPNSFTLTVCLKLALWRKFWIDNRKSLCFNCSIKADKKRNWETRVCAVGPCMSLLCLGSVPASCCVLWVHARSSDDLWAGSRSACQHLLSWAACPVHISDARWVISGDGSCCSNERCCISAVCDRQRTLPAVEIQLSKFHFFFSLAFLCSIPELC